MDRLKRMYDHLIWADDLALQSLATQPNADPRALDLYAHILAAEHNWHARITKQPAAHPIFPKLTIEQCTVLAAQNRDAFQKLFASVTEAELCAEVAYTNQAGVAYRTRMDDILMHVALHGAYHRGQIAQFLRLGGNTPKTTDYIAYQREIAKRANP